jgi:hypothetical protein
MPMKYNIPARIQPSQPHEPRELRQVCLLCLSCILCLLCLLGMSACSGGGSPASRPSSDTPPVSTGQLDAGQSGAGQAEAEQGTKVDLSASAIQQQKDGASAAADPSIGDGLPYVGLWQNSPVVGSGYSRRFGLNPDGTFHMAESQMEGLARERFRFGKWAVDGDQLRLDVSERLFWAGGEIEYDNVLDADAIIDPVTVILSVPDVFFMDLGKVMVDKEANDKPMFTIDGRPFWALAAEPDSLSRDYEEARAQALKQPAPSGMGGVLPEGCWETTDRGDEKDGVARREDWSGGKATSIREDWRALEIKANGVFQLWERRWMGGWKRNSEGGWEPVPRSEDGYWQVSCEIGDAAMEGGYLFLLTHSTQVFEGELFEDIVNVASGAEPSRPHKVLKVVEWDEDTLLIDGWEALSNFEGKGDKPPWSQGMVIAQAAALYQTSSEPTLQK